MRVCHLLNTAGTGGAETFALELARRTDAPDVSYTVCYLGEDHELVEDFEAAGARVICLDARTTPPQLDPAAVPKVAACLRRGQFDVLHAHMPYVQLLARLAGQTLADCNVVSTQHTPKGSLPTVSRVGISLTQSLDSATVAVSKGVERSFANSRPVGPLPAAGSIRTIHNGIDVDRFNRRVSGAVPCVERNSDGPVFLNVGRYVPEKGQSYLIEAMARVVETLPDAKAILVGYGPLEDDLRAQVTATGLEDAVTIAGKTADVESYYASADAFVLSSVVEGLPVVGLEAMAAALPVVGTRVPGVEEIVEDGTTGLLVPTESADSLAEAMIAIGANADRKRWGEDGLKRARSQFDIEQTVEQYLSLYRTLGTEGAR